MTAAIKPGDTVRVKDPESYVAAYAKKLADRDGVVIWVGPDSIGQFKGSAKVKFLTRNGRGKEFDMILRIYELEPR